MNLQAVDWITPSEINNHIFTMEHHSNQIEIFKKLLSPKKKEKDKPTQDEKLDLFSAPSPFLNKKKKEIELSPIEARKINDFIKKEQDQIRWEHLILQIKLCFFYQNSAGIALAPDSEMRRPHAFTKKEYMRLKNGEFNRKALAMESYNSTKDYKNGI